MGTLVGADPRPCPPAGAAVGAGTGACPRATAPGTTVPPATGVPIAPSRGSRVADREPGWIGPRLVASVPGTRAVEPGTRDCGAGTGVWVSNANRCCGFLGGL